MIEKPLPLRILARINSDLEKIAEASSARTNYWQALDSFRHTMRPQMFGWPEWVFMPYGAWPVFLSDFFNIDEKLLKEPDPVQMGMLQVCSCLAAWRPTQDIIRFDPDIYEELKRTEAGGKLPSETLMALPAWCVYIESPGILISGDEYEGFFVQLDLMVEERKAYTLVERPYLAFTFQHSDSRQQRYCIFLGDFTLEEAVGRTNDLARNELGIQEIDPGVLHALNLVTYICAYGLSDNPDYAAGQSQIWPTPQKTKKGWRIFPPNRPALRLMGSSFGEQIRRAGADQSGHASCYNVRPHVRRAHWHGFWTGPKKEVEKRKIKVQWLPPVIVGGRDEEHEHGSE